MDDLHLSVMSAIAVQAPIEGRILPDFAARTGIRPHMTWGPTTLLARRIAEGVRADLLIAIDDALDALEQDGILLSEGRVPLVEARLGVAVPSGAPQPDISTVEAFKATLCEAKGVAYSLGGASGIYFARVIESLGIDRQMRAVTIPAGFTAEKLLSGEADIAIQQVSELLAMPGVTVVGEFPQALQSPTKFSLAFFRDARCRDGAREFAAALTSPDADRAYREVGLRPRPRPPRGEDHA